MLRPILLYTSSCHYTSTGGFYPPSTTMTEPRITPQDFLSDQRPKRKRGQLPTVSGASTFFLSPNQFTVLSDSESDNEENGTLPQPPDRTPRIPPIVIYSLLDNHSSTLKQVNYKLTIPVEVKSKTDRLLLYTKFLQITTFFCQKSNQLN